MSAFPDRDGSDENPHMSTYLPRPGLAARGRPEERPGAARRSVRGAALLASCLTWLLTACATSGFDLSQSRVRQLHERGETALADTAPAPIADTAPYRIQPGDQLALRFFFNPEFDQEILVQPDGAVTVPLMGTRMVRDMSIPEVTEMVRAAYAEQLQQPQVVVQLIEAAERMVYVGGAVREPAAISYRHGLTPLEAILSTGGFTSAAVANEIILIRKDADGRPVPLVVDLEDMVMQSGETVALRPWDIVFVPKDEVSKAGEWVDKYLRNLLLINGITFGYSLNPDED